MMSSSSTHHLHCGTASLTPSKVSRFFEDRLLATWAAVQRFQTGLATSCLLRRRSVLAPLSLETIRSNVKSVSIP
jgi:hypothetical protein